MTAILSLLLFLPGMSNAASFYFSAATGNINDGAPFGGASPGTFGVDKPGPGDSFTIKAGSTATAPTGFGMQYSSITMNFGTSGAPTVLYLQSGSSVGFTANLQMAGGCMPNCSATSGFSNIYVLSGSTLDFQNSNIYDNASGNSVNGFYFWGASTSNPAYIIGSTGTFKSGAQGGFDFRNSSWSYVSFNGLGNMSGGYCGTNASFRASSITWVNSGEYVEPIAASGCVDRFTEDSDFRSAQQTNGGLAILINSNNGTLPTGRNDFTHNTVSTDNATGITNGLTFQINASTVLVTQNVFKNYAITDATSFGVSTVFSSNTVVATSSITAGCNLVSLGGNFQFVANAMYAECSNVHYLLPIVNSTMTVWGNVYVTNAVNGVINQDGKEVLETSSGGASSGTVSGNLGVGIIQSADLFDALGSAGTTSYIQYNHNTVWYSSFSVSQVNSLGTIGETYAGRSNMMTWVGNNLIAMATSTSSGHIIQDLNAGNFAQKISSVVCTGYWNIGATLYQATGKYPTYGSDVNANPNFVDTTRSFSSWDGSLGGSGATSDGWTQMLNLNGYGNSIYNSAFNTAAFRAYMQAGFTPKNTAFKGAGCDGADIGAFSVAAAATNSYKFTKIPSGLSAIH